MEPGSIAPRAAEAERSEHIEALSLARAEADAASAAKSRFLAIVSHEIRTPLNKMFLTLDILEEAASGVERQHYLAMARSSGRLLKRLIDDLLDLSRIEAGKIELERVRFDLPSLVHELLAPYAHAADAKEVRFTVTIAPEVPAAVQGDPTRFGQILGNLVDNAIKFTHAGSIEVSIVASMRTAARCRGQRRKRPVARNRPRYRHRRRARAAGEDLR